MNKVLRTVLLGFILCVPSFALPTISGSPVSASSGWTEFGEAGASTVVDSVANPGFISITSGSSSNGVAISAFGDSGPVGMGVNFGQNDYFGPSPGFGGAANFFNQNGSARVAGFYQSFTTTVAATISFDYAATQQSNASGDPFAYIYNATTKELVAFVRGNNTDVNKLDSNGSGTFTFGAASLMGNGLYTNAAYFSSGLLNMGTYVIGFGYGVNGGANPAGVNTLAISNLRATAAVPEIDAASAGLPVAIVLMVFCLIADRRRRSAIS